VTNSADPDDDGDGTTDPGDQTPNGIGTPGDIDGDGIPNANDPDIDGDGIVNVLDNDIDGDGIPNANDTDDDGDGTPDSADTTPGGTGTPGDIDGDGIPNDLDPDLDGDGIANVFDNDTDGDGSPNSSDTDKDGDGIPDSIDPTPTGSPVSGVNHAPSAGGVSPVALTQGGTASLVLKGADQDGDPLTFDVVSLPAGHTISGSGAYRIYTPPPGFAGDVTVSYVSKDHRGLSSLPAEISIRVDYPSFGSCPATVTPTISRIWPVNGRMVTVGINGVTNVKILYVRQDEKPGKTADAGLLGGSTTTVRAQRRSPVRGGDGRVYLIGFEGRLGAQAGCKGEVSVIVPTRRKGTAQLGPLRFDSTKTGAVRVP